MEERRLSLKEVVQQGWDQVRDQFLEQLRRTMEGLLEAERDRRRAQFGQQGQKVYRWGYTIRKCWQTLWRALPQVRVPRLRGERDGEGKTLTPCGRGVGSLARRALPMIGQTIGLRPHPGEAGGRYGLLCKAMETRLKRASGARGGWRTLWGEGEARSGNSGQNLNSLTREKGGGKCLHVGTFCRRPQVRSVWPGQNPGVRLNHRRRRKVP